MKRYYMVHDDNLPTIKEMSALGTYHYLDLVTHGPAGDKWNLFCIIDDEVVVKPSWVPFPPLFDTKTTLRQSKVDETLLADVGLTGEETCMEAVMLLGEIMPTMGI